MHVRAAGGAVDGGEDKFTTLSREVREEVGVSLDPAFAPVYLGGWQKGKARDGVINDNFSVFAVRAVSAQFKIDEKEIVAAQWLPWKELLEEWVQAGRPTEGRTVMLKHKALPEGRKLVSKNLLKWLELYKAGKGMKCKLEDIGSPKGGKVTIGV